MQLFSVEYNSLNTNGQLILSSKFWTSIIEQKMFSNGAKHAMIFMQSLCLHSVASLVELSATKCRMIYNQVDYVVHTCMILHELHQFSLMCWKDYSSFQCRSTNLNSLECYVTYYSSNLCSRRRILIFPVSGHAENKKSMSHPLCG